MMTSISVQKVLVKGEERFVIFARPHLAKPNEPFMQSSNLGDPPTKEEAMNQLRNMGLSEDDIHDLIAQAEGEAS